MPSLHVRPLASPLFPGPAASCTERVTIDRISARTPAAAASMSDLPSSPNALTHPDVLLVDKVKAGKSGAASELWDRFSPLVRRVIRRTISTDDVEDLVQEVFMRVFRRISTLRDPLALTAFILSVTSSVVVSDLRRRRVRRLLGLTWDGNLPEQSTALPDDENREALQRLYKVLSRSSVEERMAFVLKNVEGMELADVGKSLDISVATVKRRLAKVNEKLVRAVGDDPAMAAALGVSLGGHELARKGGKS